MNRSLVILLGALAIGAAIFAGSYFVAHKTCEMCCQNPGDDLAWLQAEFHLGDAEMARIRKLHEGYLPGCEARCAVIAGKKNELNALLTDTNHLAEARKMMDEIAALRSQCQAEMLKHFIAVSQAMPPEQGRRYFAEMKKYTLGNHEQIESRMTGPGDTGHEHHH
jgi:hypothetical protein